MRTIVYMSISVNGYIARADGNFEWTSEEDFEDLDNLRTVKPIPEVILNVYRKIYKELNKPRSL